MIQMIGSLDNEYTYIDFREFEYDLKWEFPRENLEFGEQSTRQTTTLEQQPVLYWPQIILAYYVLQDRCLDLGLLGKW